MLNSRNLNDKPYEELMEEALRQIPLYSEEWTNYNVSDPGITILENLSAFSFLQQTAINQAADEVKRKLLQLAGFTEISGSSARVLIEAENVTEGLLIPSGQRFLVGDLSFETEGQVELSNHRLTAVFGKKAGKLYDYSALLKKDMPQAVSIFGKEPAAGDRIYLVISELTDEEEIICYVSLKETYARNPYDATENDPFAVIRWQLYTDEGYADIRCRDATDAFLKSGEIRFVLPKGKAAVCRELPAEGYVLRGILEKADYDIPPRIAFITGFLFELRQQETQAVCFTYFSSRKISLFCDLLEEGYFHIYCQEKEGGSYYRYQPRTDEGECHGRFYRQTRYGYGMFEFDFAQREDLKEREKVLPGIRIVAYNEKMMRQYYLNTVYGYDDQIINIPLRNIVPDSFSVIAERRDEQGNAVYDFIEPRKKGEGMLYYELEETEGKLRIIDAGDFLDAKLFLGSAAVTRGAEGNVAEGKTFIPVGYDSDILFTNPGPGTGGREKENLEDIRKRFVNDLNTPTVPVTASDYEEIIKQTPKLLIHKVKASADSRKRQVSIAVMPYGDSEFPQLSEIYRKMIIRHLDRRRLLTTGIRLTGPGYLPVNVQGLIYVRRHYSDCRERIEEKVRQFLDCRISERQFGEILRFDELYQDIELLECVAFIYELSMAPQYAGMAVMLGNDIKPGESCLCYPGRILLEIRIADR